MKNRNITKTDAKILSIVILLLIGQCILLEISLFWSFLGSILFSYSLLFKRGFNSYDLIKMMMEGLKECKLLSILILLIGTTMSIWLSSGVIPTMIYYGFEYMQGKNFLVFAFFITSVMAIFMGTAVGTVSTIGLALLGIGKGFGISGGILLGAIVSGAYLADKISPISGLLNLTLTTTETNYRKVLKSMLKTLIPVYFLTVFIYLIFGRNFVAKIDTQLLTEYQTALLQGFNISPLLLLLPLGVLYLSIAGVKIIPTISFGLIIGILMSVFVQKTPFNDVVNAMFWGFKGNTVSNEINEILHSGGIVAMIEVVLIVTGAIILSSLLEKSGLIHLMIHKTIEEIKSKEELILKTGIISSILTVATCDQAVGIILPARLLKQKYTEFGLNNSVLARTISDTGTIIAPLIPWNVNALIIGKISGISPISYIPYAILCYVFPVATLIFAKGIETDKQQKKKITENNLI